MVHIYGIPNCNTVKKTLDFFKHHQLVFTFHDFKKEGVLPAKMKLWLKSTSMEMLLNKKGTTWRSLSQEQKDLANNLNGASAIMLENTSLIKRPVVEWPDGTVSVGYEENLYRLKLPEKPKI